MSRQKSHPHSTPVSADSIPTKAEVHSGQGRRRIVRRFDVRVFLIVVVGVGLLGAGVHLVRSNMVSRNAGHLLQQATTAEKRGDLQEAAAYVARYLQFRPNDVDAIERVANLLRRSSNSRKAWSDVLSSLEHVLRLDPDRDEARRTAIEIALKLRRYTDASRHLEVLFKRNPAFLEDRELLLAQARTSANLAGEGKKDKAASWFVDVIDEHPSSAVAYVELAQFLTSDPAALPLRDAMTVPSLVDIKRSKTSWRNEKLANLFPSKNGELSAKQVVDSILEMMVLNAKPSSAAHLDRARFRSSQGDFQAATADLEQASKFEDAALDTEFFSVAATVELAQARDALTNGRVDEANQHRNKAVAFAERGLITGTPSPKLHLILAEVALTQDEGDKETILDKAEHHLREGLKEVEKARTLLQPGEFDRADQLVESQVQLQWTLTDLILDRLAWFPASLEKDLRKTATIELATLSESGCRAELVDLLECRLRFQDALKQTNHGQNASTSQSDNKPTWPEVIKELERTRAALVSFPDLRKRADLLLGDAYRIVGNPDRRVETYRRAVAEDRLWLQGQLLLGKALADAGRTNEAIQQYQLISGVPEASVEAARLMVVLESQKPQADRNLAAVDRLLDSVQEKANLGAAVDLVRAQRELVAGDLNAVYASLSTSAQKYPDDLSLWQAIFVVEIQRRDRSVEERIEKGAALLREGEARFPESVEVRVARAELARLKDLESLVAELDRQIDSADELPAEKRVVLLENLVRYATLANEPQQVKVLWQKVLEVSPRALHAWVALADLAIKAGDEASFVFAFDQIQKIEGAGGPNGAVVNATWQLVEPSTVKDQSKLATLRKSLERATDQRPYWPIPHRLLGKLESLGGNPEQAFARHNRAFQLGDRSSETVRELIDYHYKKGNHDAADLLVQQVARENAQGASGSLAQIAALLSSAKQRGDTAIDWQALSTADESALLVNFQQAQTYLKEFQSLSESDQKGSAGEKLLRSAREEFQKMVENHPHNPTAWLAYVVFLQRAGDSVAAVKVIENAKEKLPEEPAANRLLNIAQFYEVVQKHTEAARHYELAIKEDPTSVPVRSASADYYIRSRNFKEAQKHLDYLRDPRNKVPESTVIRAARATAIVKAATGNYSDIQEAIRMLRDEPADEKEKLAHLRAQVAILSSRSSLPDRREQIRLLEKIKSSDSLTDAEALLLATLYARTDRWLDAAPIYEGLLQKAPQNAVLLNEFITAALKNGKADADLAARLTPKLKRLREVEPESIRTAETLARFEHAFGQTDAARKALMGIVERVQSEDSPGGLSVTAPERQQLNLAAKAAEDLGLYEEAESLLRMVGDHAEAPEDALVLATYYGNRGNYQSGLDVCEQLVGKASPEALGITAVTVISMGPVPPDQMARAEKLLLAAIEAEKGSLRMKTALAGFRSVQGRYEEAEILYRQVLVQKPDDVGALNNLAWLLAVTGRNSDEALRLINEAIRLSGPVATLLDTRGAVEMSRKSVSSAIESLEAAYDDSPTPYIAFHLAMAYAQAGNIDLAREHFNTAVSDGLTEYQIHATELEPYRELKSRLEMEVQQVTRRPSQ